MEKAGRKTKNPAPGHPKDKHPFGRKFRFPFDLSDIFPALSALADNEQ
jgi:hypothetical protein